MSDEQPQRDDAKMPWKTNGEGRQSNDNNKQWHPFLRERDVYNRSFSSRFFDVCNDAINTVKSMIEHDESGLLARRLVVVARVLRLWHVPPP
ncbi:hypothetical protein BISA_0657 [Bifidobacterium saguini DSM 23967]|uniref:Uncharacterized protein n=2 Tax=Bifidobacterium saguini TaxID=762210 RepID=A0A087D9R0_9BIFI|nr:hypothetical protein [Bifidobacterium saguini]KFI92260.1 hypothetical protein BISA_0657 [Bifidobacterium saguini DSM 23967]QTB90970.1 hypothetical protein BSD967_00510 [Bifidobacterium saguini]